MAFEFINDNLLAQKGASRYRQRVCIQQVNTNGLPQNTKIVMNGKTYINFSSNDYLGLNNHPKINQAMQEGLDKFGICSSSSNLVTGFNYAHKALEDKVCEWLNKPRCLLFSSGFAANEAIFKTLAQTSVQGTTHFFLDKLSHASMIDGAYASKASVKRFAHNNMSQLAQLLSLNDSPNKLIASEGVFSMDGDQAKLTALETLTKQHNAWLYLDDAHSIGLIGNQGQGSSSILKADSESHIIMATLGKAIATSGAFLACNEALHDYLVNFARHYIYSTSISPAIAWATIQSIELIQQEQWRRDKIVELSQLFIDELNGNIKIVPSDSSIHAIIIGNEQKSLEVSQKLKEQGIWLTAIRPPTVAVGTSRLRVTICANHNTNEIKHLAQCLNKALIQMITTKVHKENQFKIAESFGSASKSYDVSARLQRYSGKHLMPWLPNKNDLRVLDLGSGTGFFTDLLSTSYKEVIGLDFSKAMLKFAKNCRNHNIQWLNADAHKIPLQNESIDFIYSNLVLQWCEPLDNAIKEMLRVLKPGGLIIFTTLVDGTLFELKSSWRFVDDDQHVIDFKTEKQLEGFFNTEYSQILQHKCQDIVLEYKNVIHLARELKGLGANHLANKKNRGLSGKDKWFAMTDHYQQFVQPDGIYPATYCLYSGLVVKLNNPK